MIPMTPDSPSDSLPIVVAGMHRSGTSMTASFVQALGVDLGENLMPAAPINRLGFFEDLDFVALHQAVFNAACPTDAPGWIDIGYTERETLDPDAVAPFSGRARALIDQRRGLPVWGFKDPRTTLLLPFWDALLPEARYVLVYRYPWEVVDSLYRTGYAPLAERPEMAWRIWLYYNRALLAFAQAHPTRCVLVSVNALPARLDAFAALLGDKLGMPIGPADPAAALAARFDGALLRGLPASHPACSLAPTHFPEAMALLAALDAAADMPGPACPAVAPARAAAAAHWALLEAEAQARRYAEALSGPDGSLQVIHGLEERLAETTTRLLRAEEALTGIQRSTMWRMSAPLRMLVTAVRGRAARA